MRRRFVQDHHVEPGLVQGLERRSRTTNGPHEQRLPIDAQLAAVFQRYLIGAAVDRGVSRHRFAGRRCVGAGDRTVKEWGDFEVVGVDGGFARPAINIEENAIHVGVVDEDGRALRVGVEQIEFLLFFASRLTG